MPIHQFFEYASGTSAQPFKKQKKELKNDRQHLA
jgi:hypothetical protein